MRVPFPTFHVLTCLSGAGFMACLWWVSHNSMEIIPMPMVVLVGSVGVFVFFAALYVAWWVLARRGTL